MGNDLFWSFASELESLLETHACKLVHTKKSFTCQILGQLESNNEFTYVESFNKGVRPSWKCYSVLENVKKSSGSG